MESGRLETLPPGPAHLETVRALHQTVVSLRTALEVSKNELKELREKYQYHSSSDTFQDIIEKLTLENHILRRRIIDSGCADDDVTKVNPNFKLEVTYSPNVQIETDNLSESEVAIKTATPDINSDLLEIRESISVTSEDEEANFCRTEKLNESNVEEHEIIETPNAEQNLELSPKSPQPSNESVVEDHCRQETASKNDFNSTDIHGFKTKLELLSKFDVKIKVRTIKDGVVPSSTTSECDSSEQQKDKPQSSIIEEHKEHFVKTEDLGGVTVESVLADSIKMAVPNEAEAKSKTDKFDVQVRITSEENLIVKQSYENRRKETLNLDVDDLSFRSMSEGDNSVFSEGATPGESSPPPLGGPSPPQPGGRDEEHSGNESEEVDDIELIFTTDESKDMSNLQEDLVSIRETEPWSPSHTSTSHSTPVLIKFHTLDPDEQPAVKDPARVKRVSLPSHRDIKQFRQIAFGKSLDLPGRGILKSCDNKSDNMLYKRSPNTSSRVLNSIDSLNCEYNRNLSLDNTKSSSFEMGSSMDFLQREESMDSFQKNNHFGHRYSLFAATDISKCGISEDDLSSNLNVRRNTCPNPFQYKAGWRAPRAPPASLRPVVRVSGGSTRDSGAQTELSALPNWSSDSHLAHSLHKQVYVPPPPAAPLPPAPGPRPLRAPRLTNNTKRQLLSDIGFTSMVPELSRSADPLWAMGQLGPPVPLGQSVQVGQRGCVCGADGAATVNQLTTSNTSRYLSRGSYRSPNRSIDRSNEWTSQNVYTASTRDRWRCSLPDVRREDTAELLAEADSFIRRSIDNLPAVDDTWSSLPRLSRPYIPAEPRNLRLGHTVKVINPLGRVVMGRVRYVGLAGSSSASSAVMVGCVVSGNSGDGDGCWRGRRYFHAPSGCSALFVPFGKVVMAWAK